MPGQPKRRQVVERLESLGGIEWLCEQIADGRSLRDIATDLDCSRWLLQRWVHADPDREACYHEAKREGAAAMVEEGKALLDTADEHSTSAIQKARFRADYRKWYAGVLDRMSFGPPDRHTQVQVSIGQLHLDALKAHGGPASQRKEPLPEEPADVPRLKPGDTHEEVT